MTACDLLVIGGGINGAGIARDAAGRGLAVVLCERGDVGGATSSASSKLIHGGLRYLEYGALRLVAESLAERERLLAAAPHLVRPLRFVLPRRAGLRPAWLVRAGLLLYDRLGGRGSLGRSGTAVLAGTGLGEGLDPAVRKGFTYWDCWGDDARLVIANLQAAATLGATVLTRTACVAARREDGRWRVRLRDRRGAERELVAQAVVNAAGPWAGAVARDVLGLAPPVELRLVKGSHIVVPRVHAGAHALALEAPDRRIVFVLPFEGAFSLIGTTEVPCAEMAAPAVDDQEVRYLCSVAGRYLAAPPRPAAALWSFAGVRPLVEDGRTETRAITREYRLVLDTAGGGAPALHVFGGKLTTYRSLAERALARLAPGFPRLGGAWTDAAPLPGGQIPEADLELFVEGRARALPWLPRPHLDGLARRHGSLLGAVLGDARSTADLGRHFGAGLYEREVAWLRAHEWAESADDVLWRRTKAGLHLDAAGRAAVADYLGADVS